MVSLRKDCFLSSYFNGKHAVRLPDHSPDGAVPAVEGSDVSPDELGHVTAVSAVTRKSHDLGSGGGGGSKDFRVYQQVDEFEKDDHASNERVTVEIKSTPIEFVTVASPQEAAGQEVGEEVCRSAFWDIHVRDSRQRMHRLAVDRWSACLAVTSL